MSNAKGIATSRQVALLAMLAAALCTGPIAAEIAQTAPATQDGWASAKEAETRGDYPAMARILRPLAEQGDVAAQYTVGLLYDTGQSGRQDRSEAAKWYRKAAAQGLASAQFYLGEIYYRDTGEMKDYAEALKWYRRAADQGTAMAQHTLGIMYSKGQGVSPDYVQAYKWFSLAASSLPSTAGGYKGMAIKGRDAVAGRMTPEQIAEGQKLVGEWKVASEPVPGKSAVVH